jgi:hypothetical protein
MAEHECFKGLKFPAHWSELSKHFWCARRGVASGRYYHRKRIIELLWKQPQDLVWHSWIDRALRSFCSYDWITWTGPAASAKSSNASLFALVYWLEKPNATSVIMASTTRSALARRLWYYVQDYHSKIDENFGYVGEPLYSQYMIRWREGDMKNGIYGLAIEDGPIEEAMHNLIGYHNERVLLVVDEAQGTREAIFRACDNLAKNPEFKCLLLGNAESREDPHGRFSEPINGWLSVDCDKDEEWQTRGGPSHGRGLCVFFDGRRSPAIVEPEGGKKFPFLINQEQINAALDYYKTPDDPRFWSQSIGFWPPVGFTRTVLDEVIVRNKHVTEPATWYTSFTQGAALDPSYEGGDRKVFLPFRFGRLPTPVEGQYTWQIEFGVPVELQISVRDEMEVHYQIMQQCVERCKALNIPPDHFALGSSGEGGGLLSIFRREWGPVVGIEEAGKVSERPVSAANPKPCNEEYDRVVSELMFAVREFAVNDSLRNMPEQAVRELCVRKWEIANKKVRVETKDELRTHYNKSPDYGDAVAFCVELARRLGAIAGHIMRGEDSDWLKEAQAEYDSMIADDNSFAYANAETH